MIYLETIRAGMTVEWAMSRTSDWKVDVLKNCNLSRTDRCVDEYVDICYRKIPRSFDGVKPHAPSKFLIFISSNAISRV